MIGNAWTGGQYSMFRVCLALYLFIHFVALVPFAVELFSNAGVLPDSAASPLAFAFPNVLVAFDPPWFAQLWVALGAALTIPLALGWRDRSAAFALWYVWACLFGRNPLIANPSIAYVGWMLLAHGLLPKAPFGSWAARGRTDPRGGWSFPRPIYSAAWLALAAGYSYSGYTKLVSPSWRDGSALRKILENPLARPGYVQDTLLSLPAELLRVSTWVALALELLFLPLAIVSRARPWLWAALFFMHVGLIVLIDFADLSVAMLLFHFLTFDPAWIRARLAPLPERLFYDGACGLCHRSVRLLLAEDRSGCAFRFSPIGSESFRRAIPEAQRVGLPLGVIVVRADGAVLVGARAVLHSLHALGGVWRLLALLLGLLPLPLLELVYAGVARVRYRLFARPDAACPLMPADLRARFDID
jgi:predicted DCC family thiol-disulfide oxidoreductase YuxK